MEKEALRNKRIIKTSYITILVNILLTGVKGIVGLVTGSIAILMDAVKDLSDGISGIITIIGTKLSGKEPDAKHPYGYGRIEYITSVILSLLVLAAGVLAIKEDLNKLFHPAHEEYTKLSLILIGIAIVVKFAIGKYNSHVGKKISSKALLATGHEATHDAIASIIVLVCVVINMKFHISLEGIIGLIIAILVIKFGIELLRESLGTIIGDRAEHDMTVALKQKVASYEGVKGAYDVTLHNYGTHRIIGSVHIEVADDMSAKEIHRLTRAITHDVSTEMGILLTVGIYATNDTDPEAVRVYGIIKEIVSQYPDEILQTHGFYADEKLISFDMVMAFKCDAAHIKRQVILQCQEQLPGYEYSIALDTHFSD